MPNIAKENYIIENYGWKWGNEGCGIINNYHNRRASLAILKIYIDIV